MLIQLTGVLIWKGHLDTGTYTARSGTSSTPKTTSNPPQASREAWSRFSITVLRRNRSCWSLHLRLLVSKTVKWYISAAQFMILDYGSSSKLRHHFGLTERQHLHNSQSEVSHFNLAAREDQIISQPRDVNIKPDPGAKGVAMGGESWLIVGRMRQSWNQDHGCQNMATL